MNDINLNEYDIIFISGKTLGFGNSSRQRPCIIINDPYSDGHVVLIHTTTKKKDFLKQIALESCKGSYITIKQDIVIIDINTALKGKNSINKWKLNADERYQIYELFQTEGEKNLWN